MDKHTTDGEANSIEWGSARKPRAVRRIARRTEGQRGYGACGTFHVKQRAGICYARINPLPKISLELVTRMKAWGSADFRYTRRATAWDRDRAVSTTHFLSWV